LREKAAVGLKMKQKRGRKSKKIGDDDGGGIVERFRRKETGGRSDARRT
jgi:hypothetical protein